MKMALIRIDVFRHVANRRGDMMWYPEMRLYEAGPGVSSHTGFAHPSASAAIGTLERELGYTFEPGDRIRLDNGEEFTDVASAIAKLRELRPD